jgi:hypothetical protein
MAKKELGSKSLQQNDFLEPLAPTGVTATDVGTSRPFNDGSATVTFSLPELSPAATSFTVTSSPGGFTATGASSPLTVTGLQSNTAYTFTATATNAAGTSAASSASASITATTVPDVPSSIGASSPSANVDRVTWVAPANGGKAITGYRVKSSDGPVYTVGNVISYDVAETGGTSQSYQVLAINANGDSIYSASSTTITTTSPFFPPAFPFFPPAFGPYFPPFFPPAFPYFPPFFPPAFPFFPPAFGPYFPPYFPPPYFSANWGGWRINPETMENNEEQK